MRELLRTIFLQDALLKLIAFVLAVILFLVRSDWDQPTTVFVRVQYVHPQDRVVVSELVSEIKLVVRGPWNRVNRLGDGEIDPITIDLSRKDEGELRFTEDMVRLPTALRVGSFTPPSMYVNFEPKIEKTLTVQTVTEGEPADGYRVGKVTVTPKSVRVVGARAAIEGMRNAPTRPLRVTGLKSPVTLQIKLSPPPKFVRYPDASEITVHVDVERTLVERTYTEVPLSVTGSSHAADYTLSPDQATVVLRGPALVLDALKGTPELVVDATSEERKPPGTYRKRIQVVNLPTDVAAEIRPDSVHMTTQRPQGKK